MRLMMSAYEPRARAAPRLRASHDEAHGALN